MEAAGAKVVDVKVGLAHRQRQLAQVITIHCPRI